MFDERSLHLANGTVHLVEYAVTKMRMVTLEMHNGTHCTLAGVQFIMGRKRNLIPLRLLELQGCGLSVPGELVRVTSKGRVIMKSILQRAGTQILIVVKVQGC